MKKLLILILGVVFSLSLSVAQSADSLWVNSNNEFEAGNFTEAARGYEALLEMGERNWEVHYNLGAAYFKGGELGLAILNYERALRLDPMNEDVEYSLRVANTHTVDRIESVPQFFLIDWLSAVRDTMRPNAWTVVLIVLIALTLVAVVLKRVRGTSWTLTITLGAVALLVFFFAQSSYNRVKGENDAVVLNTAAVVRSSPSPSGNELFVLHEGTKVRLLEENDTYSEVSIDSGSKGWILNSDIEKI